MIISAVDEDLLEDPFGESRIEAVLSKLFASSVDDGGSAVGSVEPEVEPVAPPETSSGPASSSSDVKQPKPREKRILPSWRAHADHWGVEVVESAKALELAGKVCTLKRVRCVQRTLEI